VQSKTAGKNGQISVDKHLADMEFIMEEQLGDDIMLKCAVVASMNEHWQHGPAMKEKLARADEWMRQNPPRETNLGELEFRLGADS
jgi:hypothetical protein